MAPPPSAPQSPLGSLVTQPAGFLRRLAVAPQRLSTMASARPGATPYDVVYRENALRLRHYAPADGDARGTPVVLAYSLINRPAILDLQSGRSVVGRFLDAGFDVYLVDWGDPSRVDASLTIADYVTRYLDDCVDVVREREDAEDVVVFGYCMGGTLSAIYAAVRPAKVRALVLLAAGLDFEADAGILMRWGAERFFDETEVAGAFGTVPAGFLDAGFVALEPIDNTVGKYATLYDRFEDPDFVELFARVERWLRDGVDLPGATYAEFVNDLYQHNQLAANEMVLDGAGLPVDLANVTMPVLQVVGSNDHLVPPATSVPFNDRIPSEDTDVFELDSGHVGLAMSSKAHEELWPRVCEWVADRSGE